MEKNKARLVTSLIALVTLIGGVFVYAFSNSSSKQVAIIDNSIKQIPISQNIVPTTPVTKQKSVQKSEDNEGNELSEEDSNSSTKTPVAQIPSPSPVNTPVDTKQTLVNKYKNGTYSATGTYDSPAGPESIDVNISLKNDIVTSSSVTPLAQDGRSMSYQEAFIGGYKTYVIGKNIDTINLSWISGSSLTPQGFNDALSQIKTQAQA